MEWLFCELQTVARNIHSYKQSQQKFQGSTLRMARSLTTPPRRSHNLTDKNSDDQTLGLSQTSHKYSRSTMTLASESNPTTSSQFTRERSSSLSSSKTKCRGRRSVEEPRNHMTSIQEYPESPYYYSVPDYVHSSNASPKVYLTTHGTNITNYPKESYYSGTPPSWVSNRQTSIVTSTPSMSQCFAEDSDESYKIHPLE